MSFNNVLLFHTRGVRFYINTLTLFVTLLPIRVALFAQPAAEAVKTKIITVNEGTDLAVAVSPDHKTIVMDLQGLLYSLPVAGGKAKQLTTPVQEASHPNWSPSGNLLGIQSYIGGTFHIWTMKPDGSGFKQITSGHGDDREPVFSPDGKTIAFASDRAFSGSYDIWTVDVATGALKRWTSAPADEYEPAWSPDGKEIAFVSGVGTAGKTIESIDASGKQHTLTTLSSGGDGRLEAPSWSPY